MRKVGGIVSGQLSAEFVLIEARLMQETALCISCCAAARADGRLRCSPCQVAQRPAKLTPAQREAAKQRALAIGRARRREGHKAGSLRSVGLMAPGEDEAVLADVIAAYPENAEGDALPAQGL